MGQKRNITLSSAILFCGALLYLLSPPVTMGEERGNAQPDEGAALNLTLQDCIQRALKNNLEIRVEEINPKISEAEITQEKSKFDPVALLTAFQNKSLIESTTFLQGVFLREQQKFFLQKGIDVDFSLVEKLITGGKSELTYSYSRYETNSFFQFVNPAYRADLTFSITQPILRNFGVELNRSKIKID
ncbi:MAG TPA: hypothetical protein VMX95_02595, partial [Thermodesulfobacteriota bacterium]|nr:hypothetical protein [Thermodesulfobacteriota bacterium]